MPSTRNESWEEDLRRRIEKALYMLGKELQPRTRSSITRRTRRPPAVHKHLYADSEVTKPKHKIIVTENQMAATDSECVKRAEAAFGESLSQPGLHRTGYPSRCGSISLSESCGEWLNDEIERDKEVKQFKEWLEAMARTRRG